MKQLLNILLGLLIGIFSVTAQTYTFKQQEHSGFRITTSNKQQIRMKYTMQGVDLKREDVKGAYITVYYNRFFGITGCKYSP